MTDYYTEANWSLIPDHMHGAVKRYVMNGIGPGSFLTAVLSGAPLTEVAGRADDENQRALVGWAKFLYNDMPSGAHGSEARVTAWIKSGGILGQQQSHETAERVAAS